MSEVYARTSLARLRQHSRCKHACAPRLAPPCPQPRTHPRTQARARHAAPVQSISTTAVRYVANAGKRGFVLRAQDCNHDTGGGRLQHVEPSPKVAGDVCRGGARAPLCVCVCARKLLRTHVLVRRTRSCMRGPVRWIAHTKSFSCSIGPRGKAAHFFSGICKKILIGLWLLREGADTREGDG